MQNSCRRFRQSIRLCKKNLGSFGSFFWSSLQGYRHLDGPNTIGYRALRLIKRSTYSLGCWEWISCMAIFWDIFFDWRNWYPLNTFGGNEHNESCKLIWAAIVSRGHPPKNDGDKQPNKPEIWWNLQTWAPFPPLFFPPHVAYSGLTAFRGVGSFLKGTL